MKMRLIKSVENLDGDSVVVTLFLCERKQVRGWYVGPVSLLNSGVSVPYLPRSQRALGEVAVVRAKQVAERQNLSICIVDPDDLWGRLWQSPGRDAPLG